MVVGFQRGLVVLSGAEESAAGSDLQLSEMEVERHYHTDCQLELGLQFYLGPKKREGGFDEEEEEFDERNYENCDSDEDGGGDYDETSHPFVRSASEEAIPYGYECNLNSKSPQDKKAGLKRDFIPSPPSDESGGDGGYYPSPLRNVPAPPPPPSSSSSTSGSQPPSGAKRKGKKKFPEYKV
ncbi:hypothetical protein JTE90_015401 [Oedothorax gibbosus]|uniref:Uncharacterized protein n=1 Tax=Oedothorax gibbosus TaxID=931172 RepID=A0AAV6U8J2_9ARAC|nr:hypothetical protein JTE90_015401 [Oedothorax gibbosus]